MRQSAAWGITAASIHLKFKRYTIHDTLPLATTHERQGFVANKTNEPPTSRVHAS